MDLINLYKNYLVAEKRYSGHTSEAYITDIKQFEFYTKQVYHFESYSDLNHLHIRSWFANLSAKGLEARSVRRKISSLNTFFKFLKKRNLIQNNPISRVITPKVKKRLPVTVREIDLQFRNDYTVNEELDYNLMLSETIIQSFYSLGLRRSELISLKCKDVQLKSHQLKIMGKGGKERIIPFGHELRQNLERYILIREQLKIVDTEYLFLLPNGRKLYPKMVYLIVNRWLKEHSSLAKRSPHVLRHSFATHLADHGADINAIKNLLGHSNLSATQIYTHNSIEQLRISYNQAHPRASIRNKKNNKQVLPFCNIEPK